MLVTRFNKVLGIPDLLFSLSESAIIKGVGGLVSAPLMVMAVRLCPKGVEATVYAFAMSATNLGSTVSDGVSSNRSFYKFR